VGSSSRNAKLVLEKLGIIDRFIIVGDGNSVINSKPAPDIFLWVAGAMRLFPQEVLVIEDSQAGIEAAKTGGFYVLGVGEHAGDSAHAHLPDLKDHSLQSLIELVTS
jgi:beta-phosphoglucomutase-like phosphatase (HAD superfamily)